MSRTMAGILSRETILVVVFLELTLCSVRDGKSGSCWEPSSRVELHVKFLVKRLALSVDVVSTFGPLKRGMVDVTERRVVSA